MILLISVDNDTMTDAISDWLSYQKKYFIRLSENQLITKIFFDYANSVFQIAIDGIVYNLKDFKSIFYRNGGIYYDLDFQEIDHNLLEFYNSELKSVSDFLFYYLKNIGANIFGNLFTKEVNKLQVLFLAKSLGFNIPETYIISKTKDFSKINVSNKYITKAISEMRPIFVDKDLYLNYTREIKFYCTQYERENIIPSLIQEKVTKLYEIRVFFFKKQIWAIATFDFSGMVDPRNLADNKKKYLPYKLPIDVQRKIHKMAKTLNLECGTIDLLKSDDDYYFLEVNPLGQFHQVSYHGNFQIEKYIADLL